MCGCNNVVRNLDNPYVGEPMLLTIGLRGIPGLWIFGNPYSRGADAEEDTKARLTSSGIVDLFIRLLVTRIIRAVGSLSIFLYVDGSSRSEILRW